MPPFKSAGNTARVPFIGRCAQSLRRRVRRARNNLTADSADWNRRCLELLVEGAHLHAERADAATRRRWAHALREFGCAAAAERLDAPIPSANIARRLSDLQRINELLDAGERSHAEELGWTCRSHIPDCDVGYAMAAYRLGSYATGEQALRGARSRLRHELDANNDAELPIKLVDKLCDYLQALRIRVAAAFDADLHKLPDALSDDDSRWLAVRTWMEHLPAMARVADLGCGTGRFLKAIAGRFPQRTLLALDISMRALAAVPESIERRQGSLLNIPLPSGSLDGVFAVESLEHAIFPETAVGEMLRVLRTGGQLLIIDKHSDIQPHSEHEPWECWFTLPQVADWITAHGGRVDQCEMLAPDGRDVPDGLFCLWTAVKVA